MTTHLIASLAAAGFLALSQPATPPPQATAPDPALQAFVSQTDREWPGESRQQTITVESLTLLADAISSLGKRHGLEARVAGDLATLRAGISRYQAGKPGTVAQAKQLRRTLIDAATAIERLVSEAEAERHPRDGRLNAIRRAAESLDGGALLLRQPDVIERFFHHAAEALKRLEGTS